MRQASEMREIAESSNQSKEQTLKRLEGEFEKAAQQGYFAVQVTVPAPIAEHIADTLVINGYNVRRPLGPQLHVVWGDKK